MKAILIVSLLLLCVLGLCIYSVWYITDSAHRVAEPLPQLAKGLVSEDWQLVHTAFAKSRAEWEKTHDTWKMLINHEDTHDLEAAFVDLETAIIQKDAVEAQRELAALMFYLRHVPETERIEWGNVL